MAEFKREGMRRGGNRRDERAKVAAAHTEEMERRFAKEIEASAAGTRRIDGMPKAALKRAAKAAAPEEAACAVVAEQAETPDAADVETTAVEGAAEAEPVAAPTTGATEQTAAESVSVPAVTVVDQDSVAAILERGRGRAQFCDLAVLDFASFVHPGGGYERGSLAQEEALCSESFLFNVLNRNKDWYAENRRRNINCNLYRERALVAPAVRFTRGKTHAYADVIVAAAPNADRARSEYNVKSDALERAMRERIRFVLAIADELGHEKLILGAYGCGVFGWDADTVATMFLDELASGGHVAKEIVFAIPNVRYNDNFEKFEHALAKFPERNDESFAAAKAAREAAAAAAANAEDDEDEDDWRKYL